MRRWPLGPSHISPKQTDTAVYVPVAQHAAAPKGCLLPCEQWHGMPAGEHLPLQWEAHASAPNLSATDFMGCLTRYSRGPAHRYTSPFATSTLHLAVGMKASSHQTYICCRFSDRNINFHEDFQEITPNHWGEHPLTDCGPPSSLWSPRSPTPKSLVFQSSGKFHIIFSPFVLTTHAVLILFFFPLSFPMFSAQTLGNLEGLYYYIVKEQFIVMVLN